MLSQRHLPGKSRKIALRRHFFDLKSGKINENYQKYGQNHRKYRKIGPKTPKIVQNQPKLAEITISERHREAKIFTINNLHKKS